MHTGQISVLESYSVCPYNTDGDCRCDYSDSILSVSMTSNILNIQSVFVITVFILSVATPVPLNLLFQNVPGLLLGQHCYQ